MPHKDAAGRWISDDGLYVWNGGAWVPHSAPPTIAPPDEQQVEAQTDEVRGQAKQPESLIVPWALGTMTLESNALVLGMNIQEGIFRKKRSHVERRIPLGDIQAVRARESDKALEVVFRDGAFEGFQGCESLELLSRFLEGLPDSINVEAAIRTPAQSLMPLASPDRAPDQRSGSRATRMSVSFNTMPN